MEKDFTCFVYLFHQFYVLILFNESYLIFVFLFLFNQTSVFPCVYQTNGLYS